MTSTRPRPTGRSLRIAVVAAVAAVVLAGCSSGEDAAGKATPTSQAPSSAAPPAQPTAPPADSVDPADPADPSSAPETEPEPEPAAVPDSLQFEATTVSGETFEGASVAGRPVVLWFWAPWCAVCRSQAPEVTSLAAEYSDLVSFVGVGSLDSGDAIESFASDVEGPTHLSDPDGALYQRFGIAEQSSFVVLDAAGDEVLRTGYADGDAVAGVVADLAG